MLGCYSFPRHVGVHHPDVPLGIEMPTVLDALRADPAGYQVSYAQGCPVLGGDDAGIAAAARGRAPTPTSASRCSATGRAVRRGAPPARAATRPTCGCPAARRSCSRRCWPPARRWCWCCWSAGPTSCPAQVDRLAAAVCGFFPGEEGARRAGRHPERPGQPVRAAAGQLPGARARPSRAPTSPPRWASAARSAPSTPPRCSRSATGCPTPRPPGSRRDPARRRSGRPTAAASSPSTLRNDAGIPATEVVQVYLHDPVAEVARPVQQLIAAARVDLPPGSTRTVQFTLHADLTSYTGRAGRRQVDPGQVELRVGPVEHGYRGGAGIHSHRPAPGGRLRPGAASGDHAAARRLTDREDPHAPRSFPGRTAPVPARRRGARGLRRVLGQRTGRRGRTGRRAGVHRRDRRRSSTRTSST